MCRIHYHIFQGNEEFNSLEENSFGCSIIQIFINIGIFEFGSMLDLHARRVAVAKSWEPRGFEGVVTLENLYYTSNYQSAF